MLEVAGLSVVVIAITLLPQWKRHRVRVTGVSRVRSEMARHPWPLLSPVTPVGGILSPRNEPPAGPKQPDGTTVLDPPTEDDSLPRVCAVRPRRRVVLSDPSLGTTLGPGWTFK